MPDTTRRRWLGGLAGLLATTGMPAPRAAARPAGPSQSPEAAPARLDLSQFEPRSMLRVPETKLERARFPVVDVHTHLTFREERDSDVPSGDNVRTPVAAAHLLPVMDRRNIRTMVNLTGGIGAGLASTVRQFDRAHPGRFVTFTEPAWERAGEPGYAAWQADEVGRAQAAGARGLKVLKTLGLYLRDGGPTGPLVKVDDRRFDPLWEACGALGLPVAIHVGDPDAFFLPIDRFNERFEELNAHPDWSFHGRDFPSPADIYEARNRLLARHPRTVFIGLHVGNHAEDLGDVSGVLDRFPNFHVEIGARIGELGRQPRTSRRFFDRYQDRILFGSDAVPDGDQTPQQVFGDGLYEIYFRFLETEDEYFDYAPSPVPPQGRWCIYGLGLPDAILRKVYSENAVRLLRL